MPDQLHCFKCNHTWFPRYKKKAGLRKCPHCGTIGEYEVLKWHQQSNTKYHGKGNASGTEKTGFGCSLMLVTVILLITTLIIK